MLFKTLYGLLVIVLASGFVVYGCVYNQPAYLGYAVGGTAASLIAGLCEGLWEGEK